MFLKTALKKRKGKKKTPVLLVRTEAGANVLSSAGRADDKPERQRVESVFPDPARWLFLKWVKKNKKKNMKQPLKRLSKKQIYSSSPSECLRRLQNKTKKQKKKNQKIRFLTFHVGVQ